MDPNTPPNNIPGAVQWLIKKVQLLLGRTSDSSSGGGVNSVSGITNRVTSSGGTDPIIDISSTFEALLGKVASPLSQFASTSSVQLKSIISDETGSGSLVFGTAPSIATPTFTGHVVIEGITSTGATGTGNVVFDNLPTLFNPTIAAFSNAVHNHTNAAGGGQITTASLSDFTTTTTFVGAATGFSVFTTEKYYYTLIGNIIFVSIELAGTGSGATMSLTLPFAANSTYYPIDLLMPVRVTDTIAKDGVFSITSGSSTLSYGIGITALGGFTTATSRGTTHTFFYFR